MSIQEDKLNLSNELFEKINLCNIELYSIIREFSNDVKPIYPLIEFIIARLSTVTDLALDGRMWDAEIIYRSALEGIIKLVFIITPDAEERHIRIREYWTDLSEINLIKISEQAKKNIKIRGETDRSTLIFKPLVLDEEIETTLREKWPKSKRQQVERRWSFSEMIASISSGDTEEHFSAVIGLLHSYRMASHVSHADETGVSIIVERSQRSEHDQEVANMAHFARLLVDPFYLCLMLGLQICQFVKKKPTFFADLAKLSDETSALIAKYRLLLEEDKIYDKYK